MSVNGNEETRTAPEWFFDDLLRVVTELQKQTDISDAWRLFLKWFDHDIASPNGRAVNKARLTYRSAIFFETLSFGGERINRKIYSPGPFPDAPPGEDHSVRDHTVILSRRTDQFSVHIEIELTPGTPPPAIEPQPPCVQVFLNHLFLLLQMKNFEYRSIKDDITLAYNQNYLKAFIKNEIQRAKRYSYVFSVVFFDLDNLKEVNENHGHLVGTELLREVATVLRSQVRKVDLLARFGGDEFVIVLLHADEHKAHDICLRLQQAVKETTYPAGKDLSISTTGCFGISAFPRDGDTVDELIRKADAAMYRIKRRGKDGIGIYNEDMI